jgi:hypothetical protein
LTTLAEQLLARQRGWTSSHSTDWKRPLCHFALTHQTKLFRRFDRAVSPNRVGGRGNKSSSLASHYSFKLNEHGAALNDFGTRQCELGAERMHSRRLDSIQVVSVNQRWTKTGPEGARQLCTACSFRFEWTPKLCRLRARSRWVTERIAPPCGALNPHSYDETTGTNDALRSSPCVPTAHPPPTQKSWHRALFSRCTKP